MKKHSMQTLTLMMVFIAIGIGGILSFPTAAESTENVPGNSGEWTSSTTLHALKGQTLEFTFRSTDTINISIEIINTQSQELVESVTIFVNTTFKHTQVMKTDGDIGLTIHSRSVGVNISIKIQRYGVPINALYMLGATVAVFFLSSLSQMKKTTSINANELISGTKCKRHQMILETAKLWGNSFRILLLVVPLTFILFDPIYNGSGVGSFGSDIKEGEKLIIILSYMFTQFGFVVILTLPLLLFSDMIESRRGAGLVERSLPISFLERLSAKIIAIAGYIYIPLFTVFITKFVIIEEIDFVKTTAILTFTVTSIVLLTMVVYLYEYFPYILIRSILFIMIFNTLILQQGITIALLFDLRLPEWYIDHDDIKVRTLIGTLQHLAIRTGIWLVVMLVLSSERVYLTFEKYRQKISYNIQKLKATAIKR